MAAEGMLSMFDIGIIVVYFIALLVIGYIYSKRQTDEDYLIAERDLGAFSTMMTINATKTGSILMVFTALVYLWGFSAVWYFIGVIAGILLFIPFAMKLKEKSHQYYTLADYFRYNYGRVSAYFASLITIIIVVGFMVINLIAGTKIFVFFTGWPFWISSIIMISIVLFYLILSGYKAVVKTDILQYLAIVFIIIVLGVLLFNGQLIPASEWNIFKADIVTILGFFIIGVLYPFAAPELWQRVYSARGKRELKSGLLWSVIIYAFVAFLLSIVALTVKSTFPGVDPDLALVYGFANLLPSGLLGLSVVLLFGAIMSTIDTGIFTSASAIILDFFDWPKEKTVRYIKGVILLLSLIGFILAILIQDLIIGSYIFVTFIMVVAVVVMSTWIKPRIKQRTLLFGFFIGLIISVAFMIYNLLLGNIQPTIVIVGLIASIIGILIGGLYTLIKRD